MTGCDSCKDEVYCDHDALYTAIPEISEKEFGALDKAFKRYRPIELMTPLEEDEQEELCNYTGQPCLLNSAFCGECSIVIGE